MNKKVLIVDDDPDILEALKLTFDMEGYNTQTIIKGEETYKFVQKFKPDIILLDVILSGNDGRTICKKLKRDEKTKQIPIIMMSAHPDVGKSTLSVGAISFIAKPFDTQMLIKMVQSIL